VYVLLHVCKSTGTVSSVYSEGELAELYDDEKAWYSIIHELLPAHCPCPLV
jgi:hypothetical protein